MVSTVVTIIGAGNGGCAAAADLSLRGFTVRLYNRSEKRLAPIREQGGIRLVGEAGEGLAQLALITDNLEVAVRGADILTLTVPSLAFAHYAPALASVVEPDQVIFLNPGHMGGALYFAREIRRQIGRVGLKLCETTTLTYACRMQDSATVKIHGVATNVLFAAFPARFGDELYERVSPLFPNIAKAKNVLQTGLQDLNAIEHPAQILCNAGWVEHTKGDFYFYYEGTTPAVSRVIEAVDEERLAVARAAGVSTKPFVQYFYDAGYTSERAGRIGRVYEAMQESKPNRWIKGPRDLDHRYVHEDVGWGLVPWSELGRVFEVPTPTMDALIHLASVMNGIDYRTEGLTLERLGLEGLSTDELDRYLVEGPSPQT